MELFVYKSFLIFFLILILFKLTIGSLVNNYEEKVNNFLSKENLVNIQNKLRDEMKSGVDKERILSPEDAKLIRQFTNKLMLEVKESE